MIIYEGSPQNDGGNNYDEVLRWSDVFSLGISKKGVNEDNSYEDDNIEGVDENYNFQGVNQAALARHLLSPPSPSGQQVTQTFFTMNVFLV